MNAENSHNFKIFRIINITDWNHNHMEYIVQSSEPLFRLWMVPQENRQEILYFQLLFRPMNGSWKENRQQINKEINPLSFCFAYEWFFKKTGRKIDTLSFCSAYWMQTFLSWWFARKILKEDMLPCYFSLAQLSPGLYMLCALLYSCQTNIGSWMQKPL